MNNPTVIADEALINSSSNDRENDDKHRRSKWCIVKEILYNIIVGQFLAVLVVSNGLFSQQLENEYHFITPLLLTSSYYALIGIIWSIINGRNIKPPKISYLVITIVDSQANFINVYTFSMIHFEYPFIINFCSVMWTCLLTYIFIKKYSYSLNHILGIVISFLGIVLTVLGTFKSIADMKELLTANLLGILCCLLTSVLYAINGVLQEIYLTSDEEIKGFFPWIGIIGCGLTFIESFVFNEIGKIGMEYIMRWEVGVYWITFALSLSFITSLSPYFIKKCSASMFNLSLASTIFWSFIANLFIGEDTMQRSMYYFVGFGIIIFGLGIYYMKQVEIVIHDDEPETQSERNETDIASADNNDD